ncbi:MAG: winged helix-turn-helix domain-containing protein [Candidatus Nezhaarchaeales archaeon]
MIKRKRRSGLDILSDILLLLKEGKQSKTMIMRKVNLNLNRTNKYLSFLLSRKLVSLNGSSSKIAITKNGLDFVEEFMKLKEAEEKLFQALKKLERHLSLGGVQESQA